ncbi:DUF3482 domain-containing protein [Aliikangiella sp. G2MR2-5]|uniref:DUF3482 domain-containing protein n=1 Tax=Aliikangiella sp. G2MR2-5 TaxID=2788943 RepID=UPI0018AB3953|nr:DUF3482 domain-containing protein [Aliikangiella sp. G2MR2-5]
MIKRACFAVVGHPNKGKSSIVSTLCHNDSIVVSSRSGTTTHSSSYRVETQSAGYELIDTPGFQRAKKVLAWLTAHAESAAQRAEAVKAFVESSECYSQFPDEVELLKPIVNGAGILYVVDGSRPFGIEYEPEMEILRWTGQPSMALINPIENESHVEEWQKALAQYFKTVRVFNPMTADFDKQISLLETFAHLQPDWLENLSLVVDDLKKDRANKAKDSAEVLARLLNDLTSHSEKQKVLSPEQAKAIKPVLQKKYQSWMQDRELKAVRDLFLVYQHHQVEFDMNKLDLPPDLFDQRKWYAWGLDKKRLASAATMAGATAGAAIDLAVAGHSFMLGAIGGGLAGFGSAWFGADKLVDLKVQGIPLGGYQACYGPITNPNFPYVIIGRFKYFHQQVSQRNHADRHSAKFESGDFKLSLDKMNKDRQKALHRACQALAKQKFVEGLSEILFPILTADSEN